MLTFLDPAADPLGTGWNILQSRIAIGSGGWDGRGWGQGTQATLDFLPEYTTDFAFSVLAEEFGWIGVATVFALYLFVVGRCLWIAVHARDTHARLLAGSLGLAFFVYVLVNGGMISGLLPVVGIPMPLISYGGTSAVSLLAGIGLVMAVRGHRPVHGDRVSSQRRSPSWMTAQSSSWVGPGRWAAQGRCKYIHVSSVAASMRLTPCAAHLPGHGQVPCASPRRRKRRSKAKAAWRVASLPCVEPIHARVTSKRSVAIFDLLFLLRGWQTSEICQRPVGLGTGVSDLAPENGRHEAVSGGSPELPGVVVRRVVAQRRV